MWRRLLVVAALVCSAHAAREFSARVCVFPSANIPTDIEIRIGSALWSAPDEYDCSDYAAVGLPLGRHNISVSSSLGVHNASAYFANASLFSIWVDPSFVDVHLTVTADPVLDDSPLNTAWVRVVNLVSSDDEFFVWERSTDCYRCNNTQLWNTTVQDVTTIETNYDTELSVSLFDCEARLCTLFSNQTYYFGERGVYALLVQGTRENPTLTVVVEESGDADHGPTLWPVMYAVLIYAVVAIAYVVGRYFYVPSSRNRPSTLLVNQLDDRRGTSEETAALISRNGGSAPTLSDADTAAGAASSSSLHAITDPSRDKERLLSLDSFRGFSLCVMIFVNAGGGGYFFFSHSKWNGLTVADLLFPWFIWIMGTSMAIAYNSLLSKNVSRSSLLYKLLRRSAILFLLGMMVIGNMSDLDHFRVPGVLQRFSVSYLGVGLLVIFVPRVPKLFTSPDNSPGLVRGFSTYSGLLPNMSSEGFVRLSWVQDIAPYLWEWVTVLLLIIIHTCFTFLLPVDGCPTGYLGPGGVRGEFGRFFNGDCNTGNHCCVGGATGYIDRAVLTENHIFGGPTCGDTYGCGHFDPEGILGSLTSIVLCYLGLQAGRIIVHYTSHRSRVKRWLIWAAGCGVIAGGLCGFTRDEGVIPINKNLWSLSFTLCMASFGFIMLSIFYLAIDVWGGWSGAPFRYVGLNSIVVYLTSEVMSGYFPLRWVWHNPLSHEKVLFMNLTAVTCLCLMAYYLFTVKFFLKI